MKHYSEFGLTPLMAVVDIETLDTAITAVVASIGCVVVNVFTGEVVGEFYERCEITKQWSLQNRTRSDDTLEWWEKKSKECLPAYLEVFDKGLERCPLWDLLPRFNAFLSESFGDERVQLMGNGSEFDNAILEHAMYQYGVTPAWHHGGNQSLRTAVWMGRMLAGIDPKYLLEFEKGEIKHHALHDAHHEARYLCAIFQALIPAQEEDNDD